VNDRGVLLGLAALLAAGWLLGGAVQLATRQATGYMDVVPTQLLLTVLLLLGAGVAARLAYPARTARRGALAGIAMMLAIIAGYAVLTALLWNPVWADQQGGGETWFSLLIEAPFWVGVPTLLSAGLGALGWVTADRMAASGR